MGLMVILHRVKSGRGFQDQPGVKKVTNEQLDALNQLQRKSLKHNNHSAELENDAWGDWVDITAVAKALGLDFVDYDEYDDQGNLTRRRGFCRREELEKATDACVEGDREPEFWYGDDKEEAGGYY